LAPTARLAPTPQVEELLSEESRESRSVSELNRRLMDLQEEVEQAQSRLALTQSRVEQNLQRVNELKAEAAALERVRASSAAAEVATAGSSSSSSVVALPRVRDAASEGGRVPRGVSLAKRKGLASTLDMEDGLRNFWYPAEFGGKLEKDTLVPFELFGEPWVLFRWAGGRAGAAAAAAAGRLLAGRQARPAVSRGAPAAAVQRRQR
jgi:chlorophyllide a oxygenase